MRRIDQRLTAYARDLRNNATRAERILWRHLSCTRPRFTHQLVAGPFILDLACRAARLAVELDGGQHGSAIAYDARRTAWLEREGWAVLRFWNDEVVRNPHGVVEAINAAVAARVGTHPHENSPGDCFILPSRKGRTRVPRGQASPSLQGRG
jgi:very-short-patch-repair endonuclease